MESVENTVDYNNKIENLLKQLDVNVFKNILDEIEYSKYIIDLQDGWDDDNAMAFKKLDWEKAVLFLPNCASLIYSDYNSAIIHSHEINPGPDRSIDLSWRVNTARLLINIKNQEHELYASYYGDLDYDKCSIEGKVTMVNPEFDNLLEWMSNNLI